MNTEKFESIEGRCINGCGRVATFVVDFGEICDHELQGCCGYCHRKEYLRWRIKDKCTNKRSN